MISFEDSYADRGDNYVVKDGKMGDRCRGGDKSYREMEQPMQDGEEELRRSNR
jgi:hypothetical protein